MIVVVTLLDACNFSWLFFPFLFFSPARCYCICSVDMLAGYGGMV